MKKSNLKATYAVYKHFGNAIVQIADTQMFTDATDICKAMKLLNPEQNFSVLRFDSGDRIFYTAHPDKMAG